MSPVLLSTDHDLVIGLVVVLPDVSLSTHGFGLYSAVDLCLVVDHHIVLASYPGILPLSLQLLVMHLFSNFGQILLLWRATENRLNTTALPNPGLTPM